MSEAAEPVSRSMAEWVAVGRRTMSLGYDPAPIVFARGRGMWLEDIEGKRYLDFLGGIAVTSLGHAHPALVEAISSQAARVLHVSNLFFSEPQIRLQERLAALSFADRVFLCNSGAEANEAAIKLARRYQREVRKSPRFEVITFENSFHGRTYGAISATAQPKYHAGFEPMVPGFVHAPFNDLAAAEARAGEHTAAILVEPVQGEGGVTPAEPGYLAGLRALCDRIGALLIFDEVQTGIGRTGSWFAYEKFGVTPDVLTLAKGLGGGVPIGAMLAKDEVARGFTKGSHATTFGGNPLAAAAANAVLDAIERQGLLASVQASGERLRDRIGRWTRPDGPVVAVRGAGLLVGAQLAGGAEQANAVVAEARSRGLLLNTAGGQVLRLVPPLIAEPSDVDAAVEILGGALEAVTGVPHPR